MTDYHSNKIQVNQVNVRNVNIHTKFIALPPYAKQVNQYKILEFTKIREGLGGLENKQMTSVNDAKGAREPWIRDVTLLSLCWQNSFYA